MARKAAVMYHVSDMSCPACERRIEAGLSEENGILRARARYAQGTVSVTYDEENIQPEDIKQALKQLRYPVVDSKEDVPQHRWRQWVGTALILAALVLGYRLLSGTGVFDMFPMAGEDTALPVLFLIGLLTSVHCIAMCGGINMSQCARVPSGTAPGRAQKLMPSLLYNAGRVVSYTVIGGIVGAIGSAITPSGGFKGIVNMAASVFMLIMGLNMLGVFPVLRKLMPRLPKRLSEGTRSRKTPRGPFVVGLFNGLMPCGPLQAMQLYALSTGSPILGALSMFLFSAGTAPLMFGLGALSSFLSARFTGVMMKVSAVLVMLLGLIMLNNGLVLSGYNPLF